jgi:hypothetical protein
MIDHIDRSFSLLIRRFYLATDFLVEAFLVEVFLALGVAAFLVEVFLALGSDLMATFLVEALALVVLVEALAATAFLVAVFFTKRPVFASRAVVILFILSISVYKK